jgi:hypothetical protein
MKSITGSMKLKPGKDQPPLAGEGLREAAVFLTGMFLIKEAIDQAIELIASIIFFDKSSPPDFFGL